MAGRKKEEKLINLRVNGGGEKMGELQGLYDDWFDCKRCPLHTFRDSEDIVFGDGDPNADVLILGEAPGEEEERTGIPFSGPSGLLLNQILAMTSDDTGIQELYKWYAKVSHNKANESTFHDAVFEWRKKEFFITNIVGCRPPENRTPTTPEVKECWERVYNIVYAVDPVIIIALGKTAITALLGKNVEITKRRGELFEVELPGRIRPVKYPVMATLHPSHLLRKADWKTKGGDFDKTVQDIMTALQVVDGHRKLHRNIPMPVRYGGKR